MNAVEGIKVKINGEGKTIEKGINLDQLMEKLEVNPQVTVIKLNEDMVNTSELGDKTLKENDEIEYIFFMGGGSFDFSEEEVERYSRHIILQEVGGTGQQKIKDSKVLVVGAGGLGSPVSYYLAAAGIGNLGIIDSDVVDRSNLQRQILHNTDDIDTPKVDSAREKLEKLNPNVELTTYEKHLNKDNVLDIIADYDIIVDGVDNFPTRYLLNDACVMNNKTLVDGGILRFEGQLLTIEPGEGPCYRCIFKDPPDPEAVPSCQEAGILGAIAGTIGTLQATEVLKLITGVGDSLIGKILIYDAKKVSFRQVVIKKDPECPVCGDDPVITELMEYERSCNIF